MKRAADVALAVVCCSVLLAACGAGGDQAFTSFENGELGISVRHPEEWHVASRPLTQSSSETLAITSFPLRQREPDPSCGPQTAISQLPDDGALIYMFEYERYAGRPNLVTRLPEGPRHFRLGQLRAYECFGTSYLVAFHDGGRAFQVHVYLGMRATAKTRTRVLESLDSLRVTRPTLPASRRIEPTTCRRTRGRDSAGARGQKIANPIGSGPIYVSLGMEALPPVPQAFAPLRDDLVREGDFLHKTLWAIAPTYQAGVTIRGRRLGGTGKLLRFYFRGKSSDVLRSTLHFAKAKTRRWRVSVSTTALPGPGCFAFTATGPRLRERIVFLARLDPPPSVSSRTRSVIPLRRCPAEAWMAGPGFNWRVAGIRCRRLGALIRHYAPHPPGYGPQMVGGFSCRSRLIRHVGLRVLCARGTQRFRFDFG